MDLYYQSYKSSSQFFDLDDFIFHSGATVSDIFQQEYKAKYAELRAMKQEEVVTFPADWLLEQKLKIQRKDNETFAVLEQPIMGFSYDQQVTGIQGVEATKPRDAKLERTTQAAAWQNNLMPFTGRIFWYAKGDRILFYNKGGCNIHEVNVLYIPAINDTMLVPEGIIKMTIDQTVATMRQLAQGVVVKKAVDGNQNMVLEGEINKQSLK
jgi:hypothetical protein